MGHTREYLRRLFSRSRTADDTEAEQLRILFKARYHQFKLLLNANKRSLEIMAEIDEALQGSRPFGMNFVRSRCTRVATQVFQMTKNMEILAPGKYQPLGERFHEIRKSVTSFLEASRATAQGPFVVPLDSIDATWADRVGGKMAALGEIRNRMGIRTPNGFVVTAGGYRHFLENNRLQGEIDRLVQAAEMERAEAIHSLSASIQQMILKAKMPEDIENDIRNHYRALEEKEGAAVPLAVRSSALGEDTAETSFAGQYRSVLNVGAEHLLDAFREVVAGKYSVQAMSYRLNRGLRDEDVDMCVGCIRMLNTRAGGVMYSRNPVDSGDDSVLIHAAPGLPKTVVDGSAPVDLFVLDHRDQPTILRRQIARKERKLVCGPGEGVRRIDLNPNEQQDASLSDNEARELARLAMKLEAHFGTPRDIEWAVEQDGSISLLQCRPLQQRGGTAEEVEGQGEPADHETFRIAGGGITASPGVAAGAVFFVNKDADTLSFPAGAVLVAVQSLPRWATVLSRASAVVTEQGGAAGHLAGVAREFGVPALFGLNGVSSKVTNGQIVTVDADGGRLYDGRIDAMLGRPKQAKNLMGGSPVYRALHGAAQHITPLNLLNPDSPAFAPRNCKTLHDITRFCHEKSVHEMFRFGKDHRFPERSSKQLFCEVPMQWWVLNLDDGFREEVEGKYVKIENIVSIPMLSLWEGITAIPWQGPPAIDGKGFMSVMFEATRNTSLNTGVASRYGDRNYFMISRNFCNLNSRLGFHFSTVEALVGEQPLENFVSFIFRGGAADYQRRLARVHLVKDFLEPCGFRVEVRKDMILARMEGFEEGFMKRRLNVLGYLTIHTRQLDMIMTNDASVRRYRSRIAEDIEKLIGNP